MNDAFLIAEKLLQIEAVKLSPDKPFTWASGWKSPIYCDNRKILSYPFIRELVKSEMANIIFQTFNKANLIAGVATAGIAWGAMIADQLKLPFIYVRPQPKAHGLGNQIEGVYSPTNKVVVVEDLLSTGKSSMQVVEAIEKQGLKVEGIVAIFTYDFAQANELFLQKGIPTVTLTNYPALLECAIKQGLVEENTLSTLLKWRENPSAWSI